MKATSLLYATLCIILLFSSCKHKDQHQEPPSLTSDKSTVTHTLTAGTESINIVSNIDWTLTVPSTAPWLQVDKTSGTKGTTQVSLSFSENKSTSPLATDLILKGSGAQDQKIHVVQSGTAVFINLNRNTIVVKPTDSQDSVEVSSNTDWKLTIPTTASWLSADKTTGSAGVTKIYLSLPANTSTDTLRTQLSFTALVESTMPPVTVNVQHDGDKPFLSLNKSSLSENAEGQQDSILVNSNVSWVLSIPTSATWITADKTTGNAGSTKVHFRMSTNSSATSRSAELTISSISGSLPAQSISIQQSTGYGITGFTPTSGQAGTAVTIIGNFGTDKVPTVTLNSVPATVTSNNATSITFQVPMGTSGGKITVTIDGIPFISTENFTITNTLIRVATASDISFKDNISFVIGDKIYTGLGTNTTGSYSNNFKIFDTKTNTWIDGPVIPAGMSIRKQALCFVLNNKAYIGMGQTASSNLKDWWRFDPTDNSWSRLTDYQVAGYSGACFVVNGIAYVMGAPSADNGNIYQFDPVAKSDSGSWTLKKLMAVPAISTTSFSIGPNGYIVGGDMGPLGIVNDVNRYVPTSNTLTIYGQGTTPALNDVPRLVLNNKGYLFQSGTTSSIFLFDPVTNKLIDLQTTLPDSFTGQYNSAVVNGIGYIWTSRGTVYQYLP